MSYHFSELLLYFFFYAFLGWAMEVSIFALTKHKFCNRGLLSLPLCISYGILMDILIVVLPTLQGHYLLQFLAVLIISSAIRSLESFGLSHISPNYPIAKDEYGIFSGKGRESLLSLLFALGYFLAYLLLHPVAVLLASLLPRSLQTFLACLLSFLTVIELLLLFLVLHQRKPEAEIRKLQERNYQSKNRLAQRIYTFVWRHIFHAYPQASLIPTPVRTPVFARGVCFDKIIWVFFLCALLGDLIETLYCRLVGGVWMSRSSLIYGTFSIVWGIGAALLTIVLQKVANKDDRHVFLTGFFLGGAYEYLCSVFTEVFFGTTFWDYSEMKFNIGGRTNLLFCFFWAVLSVIWIKILYPVISRQIERIPFLIGKVATWCIIVFMSCDMILSAAAMLRYTMRQEDPVPHTALEHFLDETYDDALIEWTWPNMRIEKH
ncbi:MAG: putative ABC transporter permease [bacterium]|nr:putative ABC transporter permease [bacterium]